jgi:hypothetical protein
LVCCNNNQSCCSGPSLTKCCNPGTICCPGPTTGKVQCCSAGPSPGSPCQGVTKCV